MPPHLSSSLEGLGGTVHGSFFRAPEWVDLDKKPGATRIPPEVGGSRSLLDVIYRFITLNFFVYSPNLIWFGIACLIWMAFPYYNLDDHNHEVFDLQQVLLHRLAINYTTVLCFYGFWHLSLYWWNMASRPFVANRIYSWTKVWHNLFYTSLGAIQWTLVEVAFLYGYVTGRLDYISNQVAVSSYPNILYTCLWILLIPIIRDVHFYFCHRFLHLKFVYKYIHQVHHRNSDIEPFAGMSMHPAEHLYYFMCAGPLLWFSTNPFMLLWMGIHVTLSPAASHSGYEDHWQSDLYHYLHHRYFECNYGTPGLPLDAWFGTYRDRLEGSPLTQTPKDAKATLYGPPEHVWFWMLGVVVPIGILTMALLDWTKKVPSPYLLLLFQRREVVALMVATGPIVAAAVLHMWSANSSNNKKLTATTTAATSMYYFFSPFHEDSTSSLVLHTVMGGVVCCVLPLYSLIMMLLQEMAT